MPTQEVVLKAIEKQHVIAVRQILPVPSDVGTLLGEAYMAVSSKGIQPIAPPIAIYHDPEFKESNMDTEIALPVGSSVKDDIALDGGRWLKVRELPALPLVASIIHAGDYSTFDQTYAVIGQWIASNGYRIAGSPQEIYLSPPTDAAGAVTEIQFPVEKA